MAERLGPEHVHDRDFRLAFLRCDLFDCPKAALRIIRHFQMKLDLFVEDKLDMEITQDGLDPDDMDALYSCYGRFLNAFDRAGRILNLVLVALKVYKTEAIGHYSAQNPDLVWKLAKLNEGSQFRISAVHLCYSSETWNELDALAKTAYSKSVRVRTRVHHGTVLECLEQLRGHGIDPLSIPVNEKLELTDLFESRMRLQEQRKEERLKYPPRNTIDGVPFCEDVLLGKGTPFQQHPGNQKFRRMVMDRYKYEKAIKGAKRNIAQEIVDTIKQGGGLFLKRDGSQWVPVDDAVAITKVSANFRTLRLKGGINRLVIVTASNR